MNSIGSPTCTIKSWLYVFISIRPTAGKGKTFFRKIIVLWFSDHIKLKIRSADLHIFFLNAFWYNQNQPCYLTMLECPTAYVILHCRSYLICFI